MTILIWAGPPRWALIVITVVSWMTALYALLVIVACQAELHRLRNQHPQRPTR